MTTSAAARRRSTQLAFAAAVLSLVLVGVLGFVGARELANSTAGRQAPVEAEGQPTARLPATATALVGVVDDEGALTSTAAIALEPDGTGGTIVVIAASADAGSGATGELAPLAAELATDGPEAYAEAVERLTGLSFDVLEIVDPDRLAELIAPLGDLSVVAPFGVVDASSGRRWEQGEQSLSAIEAADLVTAVDPSIADWYHEPARAAVWAAIADRVGAGIGSADPVAADLELPAIGGLGEFVDRLFAGRVESRALRFEPLDAARIADDLAADLGDELASAEVPAVVVHDRAELLMVLGSIAPARLGAPLEAPRVRVVSGFSDDELDDHGVVDADVLKVALDELLFAQVNVVSVASLPGSEVPETTQVRVAEPDLVPAVDDTYGDLFGGSDAVVAGEVIEGVDLEVVLGRSLLDELDPVADSG